MRLTIALLLSLAASAAFAQRGDPLLAPECASALKALSAEEDAVIARRQGAEPGPGALPPLLLERRKAAARACLGTEDAPPPAGARIQWPLPAPGMASPTTATSPARPAPPPARLPGAAAAPPPIRQPPLVTITGCDALGCWASDGTRLQQQGPNLLGPRGFCFRQGAFVTCP